MSKLPNFELFLSVGNLKPKLKSFFKLNLKSNNWSIKLPPCRHVIGVTTEVAYYYLTEPSDDYLPFMREIDTKTFIAKCVIEHLMSTREEVQFLIMTNY